MKIILILYVCSYVGSSCLPGYQWPNKFDDMYDCMPPYTWHETFEDPYSCSIFGYEESARKLREIGQEEVNKLGISITFRCSMLPEANI